MTRCLEDEEPLLKRFSTDGLCGYRNIVAAKFSGMAYWIVREVKPSPGRRDALLKLLEAKEQIISLEWPKGD